MLILGYCDSGHARPAYRARILAHNSDTDGKFVRIFAPGTLWRRLSNARFIHAPRARGTAKPRYSRSGVAALSRRSVDGARAFRQYAGRLSSGFDRSRPLARGARQRTVEGHPIELLGFIAARVEGGSRPRSTARQFRVSGASIGSWCARADHGGSDGANRDAENRPLPAEVPDGGRSRFAARGADRHRSAGTSRPHHARGSLRDGLARLRTRQPQA